MKRALIISSSVAASSVGANVTAFAMRSLGIEAIILPTTLFGRHPGWGDPGGAVTPPDILTGMWDGIKAQNLNFDAVITGYMGSVDSALLAAKIIDEIKQENPNCLMFVDPVMGDEGRLYVPVSIADHIVENLVPKADVITPNLWELSYILGRPLEGFEGISRALATVAQTTIVSSVSRGRSIGVMLSQGSAQRLIEHDKYENVPHGGGDTLTGLIAAHLLRGETTEDALLLSVSSVYALMSYAQHKGRKELPVFEHNQVLEHAPLLKLETIK